MMIFNKVQRYLLSCVIKGHELMTVLELTGTGGGQYSVQCARTARSSVTISGVFVTRGKHVS